MERITWTWLALAGCLAIGAALPGVASANTYCVVDPACVSAGGIDSGTDPEDAFADAAANPGHDRVEIGPGEFVSDANGFLANVSMTNTMEIVGAGAGTTVLKAPDTALSQLTTLYMGGTSPGSSIKDLSAVAAGATVPSPYTDAIGINGGGTIERVEVTADPDFYSGLGITLNGTLRDSVVTMPNVSGDAGVRIFDATSGVIEDSTLQGFYGIYSDAQGTNATDVLVRRVRIKAYYSGVYTQSSDVTVENSLIELLPEIAGSGVEAITGPMTASTTTVRNTTIVGTGSESGVIALGLDGGQTVTLNLNSSIVHSVLNSLNRIGTPGTANINAAYSNYTAQTSDTGAGTLTEGAGNKAFSDPGFASLSGGDYALTTDSPVRDLGDPASFMNESTTDLDGALRIAFGRRDMGAFEYQARLRCAGRKATLVGTNRKDTIIGTASPDVIAALGGNDVVRGLAGNDHVCGGAGRDRLIGGGGRDTLLGEAGKDVLKGGAKRDVLKGGAGRDRLLGGPGRDKLRGGPGRDLQRQ